jgi:hypothetical protein
LTFTPASSEITTSNAGSRFIGYVRELANSYRPPVQNLRWSNAPEVPYHSDGLFVPRSWAGHLRDSEVVSSVEWDRLNDYNPVVARFGLRRIVTEVRSASDRKPGLNTTSATSDG